MTDTEKKLGDFFKQGGAKVVGAVVMWSLSGVRVDRQELREALESIGLGKAVPKDPRPTRLLSKAVEATRAGSKGFLFRKLSRSQWAIVAEREYDTGDSSKLDHDHVITLRMEQREDMDEDHTKYWVPVFDRVTTSDGIPKRALELADAIVAHYEEARLFANTDDVSIILTQAMAGTAVDAGLGAVSLREGTGGVYFVPGCHVETVQRLKAVVDKIGSSHVTCLTLYGDQENLEEAAHAARASFTAKLNELKGELADFVTTMLDDSKTMTDKHVETRVRRLGALQERVDMWKGALGDVQGELAASITQAQQEVAKAMGLG